MQSYSLGRSSHKVAGQDILSGMQSPWIEPRVEWRDDPDARLVWVYGEIDLQVGDQLLSALDTDRPRLVVDLTEATFIDLTNLRHLQGAAARRNVEFIPSPHSRVRRLLELTGTTKVFEANRHTAPSSGDERISG